MWTVFSFLNLGVLLLTVSSSLPSPTSVVFSSLNLRNVLQWSPGNGTPFDTYFTVQYAIYGDSTEGRRVNWRAVLHCTEIVQSWCDLSNETWDQEQGYYARVRAVGRRASSKWALTRRRFDPKSDTSFGPPLVFVEVEGNSALITLKGPMRYQPNNHTSIISMATFYPQMAYNLSVHNTRRGKTHHFPVVSRQYKYRLMEHETEYCFSAKTRFLSMPVQCQSSAWHCIITPKDPATGQLQLVVWGIVVPSLSICALLVVGYFLRNYLMGNGQKSPYTLNPRSFHCPHLTFPPENPNLIFISVIRDESLSETDSNISDPTCPKRQQHSADPPPRYSLQRPRAPSDVSIDYAFLAVAPKVSVGGEAEAREGRHEREEGGDNLNDQCQKCMAAERYEKKEWRVDFHSAGVYSPQEKSFLSQRSAHSYRQAHVPIHFQTEMSTLVQAQAWSQLNSVSLTQNPGGSSPSFQGAVMGGVDREECPGLFLNRSPQTGLFHIPLNRRTQKEVGMGGEMDEKVRVRTNEKIDGAAAEGHESENVALLSAYASQSIEEMPSSHADQSDYLLNDYGVLSLPTAHVIEEDDEEEEEGTIHINWDPETRKLVLPEMGIAFSKEGGLRGSTQAEEGSRDGVGGEEVNVVKGELKLENVFVRQASEEEAEALREMERGGEAGWEVDNVLSKWSLVISMDQ